MFDTTLQQQPDPSTGTATVPAAEPAKDNIPPHQRYLDAICALHEEAVQRQEVWDYIDVMIWNLAAIAADNGALCGEILSRIGDRIRQNTQWRWAQAEAEEARKQGLQPH